MTKTSTTIDTMRSGFTLVEVLLVVALIALLAGVGAAIHAGTSDAAKCRQAARDFYLAARYARTVAIEQQKNCRILFNETENAFVVVVDQYDPDEERLVQVPISNAYVKPRQLREPVRFEHIRIESTDPDQPLEEAEIIFQPNGSAQSALVQIGDGQDHYTIHISAVTAKVRIYELVAADVTTDTFDLDQEQWFEY